MPNFRCRRASRHEARYSRAAETAALSYKRDSRPPLEFRVWGSLNAVKRLQWVPPHIWTKITSRSHSTRLRRHGEHCCPCCRTLPGRGLRLAASAGLVVVQASRQARCGSSEGIRQWPINKPASKQRLPWRSILARPKSRLAQTVSASQDGVARGRGRNRGEGRQCPRQEQPQRFPRRVLRAATYRPPIRNHWSKRVHRRGPCRRGPIDRGPVSPLLTDRGRAQSVRC